MKLSFKFHKDRSFGNGDICKIKLTLIQPFLFYAFCQQCVRGPDSARLLLYIVFMKGKTSENNLHIFDASIQVNCIFYEHFTLNNLFITTTTIQ